MVFKEMNSRAQVDLMDLQSTPGGEYKFITTLPDHLTKFVHLRPLKNKESVTVARELLPIFLEFGASSVLQSDNGREFANQVINALEVAWPDLKIVHGQPRHSRSQSSVERANRDVEGIVNASMTDNHTIVQRKFLGVEDVPDKFLKQKIPI
ncbi:KRAB-A domain-containing protein 2-like [Thrips palmi]|uniref:KRAB-A domain-containing protein 2-like n=1 Tax=Thrips palmi TaxID=161013 RepID=A0A6P8ZQE5_THRPL|nr:KRAB-A domain-containing protein 2-like [Thrips palmi]